MLIGGRRPARYHSATTTSGYLLLRLLAHSPRQQIVILGRCLMTEQPDERVSCLHKSLETCSTRAVAPSGGHFNNQLPRARRVPVTAPRPTAPLTPRPYLPPTPLFISYLSICRGRSSAFTDLKLPRTFEDIALNLRRVATSINSVCYQLTRQLRYRPTHFTYRKGNPTE